MDRIKIKYSGEDEITAVFSKFDEYIKAETLTDEIIKVSDTSDLSNFVINDRQLWMKNNKKI